MKYTAGKAAQAAGLAKSTITKAISSGKLSAIKNANGAWEIDPAELHRVFPPKQSEANSIEQKATPAENTQEIEFLKKQLEAAQEQIEDIKEDRDAWRNQANTLLISHQGQKKKGPFGLW
jgi:hypothetical protein